MSAILMICDVCGKEFDNRKSMTNHRRWHNLPEYKEYQSKKGKVIFDNENKEYILSD